MTEQNVDVRFTDYGSVVAFAFLTAPAREWLEANVVVESWQWMGDCVVVDHRCGQGLLDLLVASGFSVTED